MNITHQHLDQLYYYYAIAKGKNTGIYGDWATAEKQVDGFSGPIYKGFSCKWEAVNFLIAKLEWCQETDELTPAEIESLESCKKLIEELPKKIVWPSLI
jgi:viroplasmin and RNaseH domain-containing protein